MVESLGRVLELHGQLSDLKRSHGTQTRSEPIVELDVVFSSRNEGITAETAAKLH